MNAVSVNCTPDADVPRSVATSGKAGRYMSVANGETAVSNASEPISGAVARRGLETVTDNSEGDTGGPAQSSRRSEKPRPFRTRREWYPALPGRGASMLRSRAGHRGPLGAEKRRELARVLVCSSTLPTATGYGWYSIGTLGTTRCSLQTSRSWRLPEILPSQARQSALTPLPRTTPDRLVCCALWSG